MRGLLVTFCVVLTLGVSAQRNLFDSVAALYKPSIRDTTQLQHLIAMSQTVKQSDSALMFAEKAWNLALVLRYPKWVYKANQQYYKRLISAGSIDEGVTSVMIADSFVRQTDDLMLQAKSANTVGRVHYVYGTDQTITEQSFLRTVDIYTELKDTVKLASAYMNLGVILGVMGDVKGQRKYYFEALKVKELVGDPDDLARVHYNLGSSYAADDDSLEIARQFLEKALAHYETKTSKSAHAMALASLADVDMKEKKYSDALEKCLTGLKAGDRVEPWVQVQLLVTAGDCYVKLGNSKQALGYLEKGQRYANKHGLRFYERQALAHLANSYADARNYGKAYWALNRYTALHDSMLNEETIKNREEMEAKFHAREKELKIQNLETNERAKQALIDAQEIQLQQSWWMLIGAGIGIVLLGALAVVVFRSAQQRKKDNALIMRQKKEVEMQKLLVEERSNEVTESIQYAKRLQNAVLPDQHTFNHLLPNGFVLFLPKDIVSGDFYWMDEAHGKLYVAVADCTGHGVPGAMVSLLGINALHRCITEYQLQSPAKILDKLTDLIESSFESSDEEVKDGMDIALIALDRKTRTLSYSGANNPLYFTRNGGLEVVKADKQPIGKHLDRKPFEEHTVELSEGDSVFLFSDGYADQFGGPRGKKFKYAPMRELLLNHANESPDVQRNRLKETFEDWRGEYDQIDDICVLGFKV